MGKTKKRMLVLLLSALIIAAFMPVMSFADDISNGGSTLTAAQMSGATEIKVGDTVTLPSSGSQVYKFTATDSDCYGFALTCENYGYFNIDGYNHEGKSSDGNGKMYVTMHNSPQFEGYTTYAIYGLEIGETYYVVVSPTYDGNGKVTATFNKLGASKIKVSGKGRFDAGVNFGVIGSFGVGYTGCVKPKLGYAFKGLYYGNDALDLTYETSTTARYYISKAAVGKTIVAKFAKVGVKGKTIQKNKLTISSYSVNLADNTISFKIKSKAKLKYYMLSVSGLSDSASAYADVSETTGSFTTDFEGAKVGEQYVVNVYRIQKVKGLWVFTPVTQKTITIE